MPSPRPFGRRVGLQRGTSRRTMPVETAARPKRVEPAEQAVRPVPPIARETERSTQKDDLPDWNEIPHPGFRMPWRPVLLMASLCFGVASLVLPDSVNDAAEWLLWALTAASLIGGVTRPKRAS